jgi:hypothetical protein
LNPTGVISVLTGVGISESVTCFRTSVFSFIATKDHSSSAWGSPHQAEPPAVRCPP